MKDFFSYLFKYHWKDIILVMLAILEFISMHSCNENRKEVYIQKQNFEASLDSVRYYKTKHGELYGEKLSYISTQKELKDINEELYNKVKELDKKLMAGTTSVITVRDTIPIYKIDTVILDITKDYQSKTLFLKDNIFDGKLQLGIYKDYLKTEQFNYQISLPVDVYFTNDYSVILKSTNNVTFTNVQSFIDPSITSERKIKRWGVAIHAGFGLQYGIFRQKFDLGPYLGMGLSYNLY